MRDVYIQGLARDPDSFTTVQYVAETLDGNVHPQHRGMVSVGWGPEDRPFENRVFVIPEYVLREIATAYLDEYYKKFFKYSGVDTIRNMIGKTDFYFRKMKLPTPDKFRERYYKLFPEERKDEAA